ncbi:MAG: MutS-related protein [Mycobacterium sp.]
MKVRLLHPEHDRGLEPRLPWQLGALINEDLELGRLYDAMAGGDAFLRETAEKVVPLSVTDPDVIVFRQRVLTDCLTNRSVVQQLYDTAVAVSGLELRHKVFLGGLGSRDQMLILRRSVRVMELLTKSMRQLRGLGDTHGGRFSSTGFRQLFTMFAEQLSDDYLAQVEEHLRELHLPRGLLLSARTGPGNYGADHVLHQPARRSRWAGLTGNHSSGSGFVVDDSDLADAQALAQLAGRAINDVANSITQSAEHIQRFFGRLRTELAFYLGCLNLHDTLTKHRVPMCFPVPAPIEVPRFDCRGLRDVALCLITSHEITGNDVAADGKTLIVITGANGGGKSTFLRSVGAAHLMMQAGMFVTAQQFSANVRNGVVTHFTRQEDVTLTHGKLDEELTRMSALVDYIGPTSLLLSNESFASTNAREGSQIAQGIVDAMVESGVKVILVTHLYDLAHSLRTRRNPGHLFLQAERLSDGVRTYRLAPGDPEATSYGEDCFRKIFGTDTQADGQPTQSDRSHQVAR